MKQRLGGGFKTFSKIWSSKCKSSLNGCDIFQEMLQRNHPFPVSAACGSPETLGWRVAWDARPRNHQKLSWEHIVFDTSPWECLKTWYFKHFLVDLNPNVYTISTMNWCSNFLQHDNVCDFFGKTTVLKVENFILAGKSSRVRLNKGKFQMGSQPRETRFTRWLKTRWFQS